MHIKSSYTLNPGVLGDNLVAGLLRMGEQAEQNLPVGEWVTDVSTLRRVANEAICSIIVPVIVRTTCAIIGK